MNNFSQFIGTNFSISKFLDELESIIIYKDLNGIYLDCNKGFIDFIGKDKSEIIGKTDYFLFNRKTAEEIRKYELESQDSNKAIYYDKWLQNKDNISVLLRFNISPVICKGDKVDGILCVARDVTSSNRFQMLLDGTDEAQVFVKNNVFVSSNKPFLDIIKYKAEELKELSFSDLFENSDFMKFHNEEADQLKTKFRTTLIDRLFNRIDVIIERTNYYEGNLDLKLFQVKRISESLVKMPEGEKKKVLVDNSPIPTILIDYSGIISLANKAAKVTFESDLEGNSIEKFIPMLRGVNFKEIKDNEVVKFEVETRNKIYSFFTKNDSSFGCIGLYGVDITQRYIDSRKIKLQNQILDIATDGIVITELDGKIIWCNPAIEKLTGYSFKELSGQKPNLFKSGKHTKQFYVDMWETVLTGKIWTGKIINRRKDGELTHEAMTITPVKNAKGLLTHFITIKRDISQFIKVEEDLKLHRDNLEKIVKDRTNELQNINKELLTAKEFAEKSDQLKSEFLAQISHEIRTPVNAILSFSSMLELYMEGEVDEDLNFSFQMIKNGGERLIRTIDLILNKSELQLGTYHSNFKKQNLVDEVITPLVMEFKPLAKRKSLSLSMENNLPENYPAYFDKYSMWNIISHLIDNAIKYTDAGGVTVVSFINYDNKVEVDVKDTGIGISDKFLPAIFEAFSQEQSGYTRKFEGNGLGLSLVKDYCDLNNCKIKIETKKDVGTTFRIIIPN
ncbi:MAG: PAS domain-containing protein [Melioribacteraceae bacterium]|nr:PAS domain-containing protein [Melioribacteraceae bacterium]